VLHLPLLALALLAAQPDPIELGPFRACLSLSDDAEALPWCRRAALEAGQSPRASVALLVLGIRLGVLGRWDEAVAAYRRQVALAPDDAAAHRRLGEALLNGTGEVGAALAALDESLRLDPGDAGAHGFRGVALNALGRHPEAVRAFEDALGSEPSYFTLRPAARRILEASQRGERWPPTAPAMEPER
jgi:tetratricopeptide (TPR) repeat protein